MVGAAAIAKSSYKRKKSWQPGKVDAMQSALA